jgi:segregation and condensation protein B
LAWTGRRRYTPTRLAGIVEVGGVKEVKDAVKELNEKYRQCNSAFRVEEIAGGLQLMTLSNYNHWLKKLIRVRGDSKLTQAGLETLAIIAYKQPIIRADVEAIRGVGSGEMIRSLMYKGMVKIAGRAEVLGRPLLYGTTKKFLDMFGLNNLKDLPKVEELKKPEE